MNDRQTAGHMVSVSTMADVAAIVLASALSIDSAVAQDFRHVAPDQPTNSDNGSLRVDQSTGPAATADHKLLLQLLAGIKLVQAPNQIVRTGVNVAGVAVEGEQLALLNDPRFQATLTPFLGKPLYADDLQAITSKVLEWYRARNLPVVDVTFPEQDISGGTVQAVVSVYRLGKVKVEGNRWFSAKVLSGELQSETDRPVDFAVLKRDLNRLNRNPFRSVDAVLQRSETIGATDLLLRVHDRFPLRVFAGYDNNGLPVTGRTRISAGFNYGNLFGLDQQLSYSFITSPDLFENRDRGVGHSTAPRLAAHSVDYSAPLPWGDTIEIFGSHVTQVPNLGANFDQVGHSFQLGLRYGRTLPAFWGLSHQLQFGFDHKQSDNNLAFGGTKIFASSTKVEQFLLIYSATRPTSWGQTAVENQFVISPGGLSSGNTDAVFQAGGTRGAKARYAYDNLQITQLVYMPHGMSAVARLVGQLATAELLPSEQLGAGGSDSVRGYDPRVFNGTKGILASFELRSPSFSPLRNVFGPGIADSAQVLAFYDMAAVSDLHQQTFQAKSATLQSVGLGLRYSIARNATVNFDYGWQLDAAPGTIKRGSIGHVSIRISN